MTREQVRAAIAELHARATRLAEAFEDELFTGLAAELREIAAEKRTGHA